MRGEVEVTRSVNGDRSIASRDIDVAGHLAQLGPVYDQDRGNPTGIDMEFAGQLPKS